MRLALSYLYPSLTASNPLYPDNPHTMQAAVKDIKDKIYFSVTVSCNTMCYAVTLCVTLFGEMFVGISAPPGSLTRQPRWVPLIPGFLPDGP